MSENRVSLTVAKALVDRRILWEGLRGCWQGNEFKEMLGRQTRREPPDCQQVAL
jgi:hypothetical protein